jgi:hypothetical protein
MDGCPCFCRKVRLLENLNVMPLVAQSDGCGQSANASANDQDLERSDFGMSSVCDSHGRRQEWTVNKHRNKNSTIQLFQ